MSTTYKTITDVPYYEDKARASNEYLNQRCKLDIYYPDSSKGFATIIWLHGGGIVQGERHIDAPLKDQGFAVVAANYRLHPGAKSPEYIEDAAQVIAWVMDHIADFGGDPKKIFLSGHSAGAYLGLMVTLDKRYLAALGKDPDTLAGVIPLSAQTITHMTIRQERGIDGTQAVIDEFAPLFHVRADAPPMLVISGDRELEILGRYEENAYFYRMMKVVGHTDIRHLEMQGYGHDMLHPAYPLLVEEVRRRSAN